MPLNYSLRDNNLTKEINSKTAQIEGMVGYSLSELIMRITERGNTMTKTDLMAAINAFFEEVLIITREGNTVNTPLFNTSFSIGGVFNGDNDTFDPARHTVNINLKAGVELKKCLAELKPNKVQPSGTLPVISSVRDVYDENSESLKAGTLAEINGSRLKFDKADKEQGVFFISATGETRLDKVADVKQTKILVQLPLDIETGVYTLEIRTRNTGNKSEGKALKRGVYKNTVSVR